MSMLRRSRRRGMIMGAAIANSRNRKAAEQQAAPVAPAQPASSDDSIEQIKKLAELRDAGILTDAEFEAKKKQLLGL